MSFSAQAWPLPLLLVLSLAAGVHPSSAENGHPSVPTPARSDSSTPDSVAKTPSDNASLKGDARILHALDRLTFGPRPADLAKVKAMGIEAWIDQQLQPQQIDDAALQEKLKMYPVIQMSGADMIEQLPPPPVIRQVIDGKRSIPDDVILKKVYQTQIALYEMRQQVREEKQALPQSKIQTAQTSPTPEEGGMTGKPSAGMQEDVAQSPDSSFESKKQKLFADLEATHIANLPPQQRMEKVLAMQPQDRIRFYQDLSRADRLAFVDGLTPDQAQLFSSIFAPLQTVASELEATKMLRVIDSNRQLQEVMTDFWLNHFNVDIRKSPLMPYYLAEYENQVIRANALGNFEDLLVATAQSRAMLLYLDNASSTGPNSQAALRVDERAGSGFGNGQQKPTRPGLNENYGRELMELQTLGVNGGYTQQDVIAVAKVFTGWTIEKPLQGGGFVFNPRRHEPGTKVVLGHAIPEGGEQEGLEVLHILATSPATAHHISEELAERFVSDHPPETLINRMTRTFLATHGNIRQVLRTMFFSPEFWERSTLNAKVKTPLELVASAARASDTQVERPAVLALAVARLGMPLYACQPPNGYSLNADAWVSAGSLVERMNFAMAFAYNRLPDVVNHWDDLIGPDAENLKPSQKESRLETLLLHGDVSPKTHDAVMKELVDEQTQPQTQPQPQPFPSGGGALLGYVAPLPQSMQTANGLQPRPTDSETAMSAGLLLGSPDFQTH